MTTAATQASLFAMTRPTIVSKQTRMLQRCIADKTDLSEHLAKAGMGYKDLRYCSDLGDMPEAGQYVSLSRFKKRNNGIPVVSFFSGCGGLDLGFEAAGFNHQAAVEVNAIFAATLKLNRPGWTLIAPPAFKGDIHDVESIKKDLRVAADVNTPFNGVFIGGPPCQPFSKAGEQRGFLAPLSRDHIARSGEDTSRRIVKLGAGQQVTRAKASGDQHPAVGEQGGRV